MGPKSQLQIIGYVFVWEGGEEAVRGREKEEEEEEEEIEIGLQRLRSPRICHLQAEEPEKLVV